VAVPTIVTVSPPLTNSGDFSTRFTAIATPKTVLSNRMMTDFNTVEKQWGGLRREKAGQLVCSANPPVRDGRVRLNRWISIACC